MVAHAAQVSRAGVGPQRFLAGIGAVMGGEERNVADAEIRCRGYLRRDKALVDQLPAALETDTAFTFCREGRG